MKIGVPRESKVKEGRVGLIPDACADLVRRGHDVFIEANAGVLSGYSDDLYTEVGCNIVSGFSALVDAAQLIVKVKEPLAEEAALLSDKHLLFCYLHLAAVPELAKQLMANKVTAIAFETVTDRMGTLPLLKPMSEIAGKLAIQNGTVQLHQPNGGAGVMIGGVGATPRAKVVVLGCGNAGFAAAELAANIGAEVIVFDKVIQKLDAARSIGANVTALYPYETQIRDAVADADLVVGAVLIPGARAPVVVSEKMVESMRAGSVVVDIAIDQGGCIETIKPTNYQQPTYVCHDIIHFGVTNMPGAVPRTASQALSAAIAPYVEMLTKKYWKNDKGLQDGINVEAGKLIHPALIESLK